MTQGDAAGLADRESSARRGGWSAAKAAAVVILALPVLDFLAKAVLGGMGWAFLGLFVLLGPLWLVWYLGLVLVAVLLWRRGGVFKPGGRWGRWLVFGSVAVQLGLFTMLCWLICDASDQEDWPSPLGRLLGLSYAEDRSMPWQAFSVHGAGLALRVILCAFLLMLATMFVAWVLSSTRRRGVPR